MLRDSEINRIESELADSMVEKEKGNYLFLIEALSECSNDLGTRWTRLLSEREALPFLETTEQILKEYAKHIVKANGDLDIAVATNINERKDDYQDVA
jgi:hypothetical protein